MLFINKTLMHFTNNIVYLNTCVKKVRIVFDRKINTHHIFPLSNRSKNVIAYLQTNQMGWKIPPIVSVSNKVSREQSQIKVLLDWACVASEYTVNLQFTCFDVFYTSPANHYCASTIFFFFVHLDSLS